MEHRSNHARELHRDGASRGVFSGFPDADVPKRSSGAKPGLKTRTSLCSSIVQRPATAGKLARWTNLAPDLEATQRSSPISTTIPITQVPETQGTRTPRKASRTEVVGSPRVTVGDLLTNRANHLAERGTTRAEENWSQVPGRTKAVLSLRTAINRHAGRRHATSRGCGAGEGKPWGPRPLPSVTCDRRMPSAASRTPTVGLLIVAYTSRMAGALTVAGIQTIVRQSNPLLNVLDKSLSHISRKTFPVIHNVF